MRVLVVEDEALIALAIEDEMLNQDWSVVLVGTAADAMQEISLAHFDVAVVDLGLPDMRGDELICRLRRRAPSLGVVVCSGYDVENLQLAADIGDVVRVRKPWEPDELARAVTAVMTEAHGPAMLKTALPELSPSLP